MTRVVNIRKAKPGTYIYIGRGSIWGNPYTDLPIERTKAEFQVATRDEAIDKYEPYARANKAIMDNLHMLLGRDLGCFCHPKRCHGNTLVKLVQERFVSEMNDDTENLDLQPLLFPCD